MSTVPNAIRSKRHGAKLHRSSKAPGVPAEYAGDTVCGKYARDMSVVVPVTDTDSAARCVRCWKGTEWESTGVVPVVAGHGLVSEGHAFNADGSWSHERTGHAKCGCGEMSEELPSTSARQKWHRGHKADVAGA